MNTPPDIAFTLPESDGPLPLDFETVDVRVYAFDADEDPLLFAWSGVPADLGAADPAVPLQDDEGRVVWLSTFRVTRDARLDGRPLECVVSDIDDEVRVRWILAVED